MHNLNDQRKLYWLQALIWLNVVYLSIPIVRPICEALRIATPFNLFINSILIIFLVIFIYCLFRKAKFDALTYGFIVLAIILYGIGMVIIKIPEERIHFVQYGILAILIIRAFRLDIRGPQVYWVAFLLTSLLGWLDEGLQYLTPGRYYSNSDVILNAVSGVMGLYLDFIYQRLKPKEVLGKQGN